MFKVPLTLKSGTLNVGYERILFAVFSLRQAYHVVLYFILFSVASAKSEIRQRIHRLGELIEVELLKLFVFTSSAQLTLDITEAKYYKFEFCMFIFTLYFYCDEPGGGDALILLFCFYRHISRGQKGIIIIMFRLFLSIL